MPGPSWSISAERCITGSQLAKVPGTACSKCYARKGRFTFGPVRDANEQRLVAYYELGERWPKLMARLIELSVSVGDPYFRWFSSGDLQSEQMLCDIMTVCELTPLVRHWLPTQERGLVRSFLESRKFPRNLVIRVSAPEINGVVPVGFSNTSVVVGPSSDERWEERVSSNTETRYHCPAPTHAEYECGHCRTCWSSDTETVVYKLR